MANNYPSPCIACPPEKKELCDKRSGYSRCNLWLTRYRYKQKQINEYARRMKIPDFRLATPFTYDDPDVTKRFLQHGPCASCELDPDCNKPCGARLLWWDLCMLQLRKKVICESTDDESYPG